VGAHGRLDADGVDQRAVGAIARHARIEHVVTPHPEDADEFYHADLIGLRAEDTEGRAMGTVRALHNFGAGNVIELVRDDGDEVFLPFTREVAQQIDIEGGRIVIAAPEEVEAGEKGNVE
jgi:16S rRNA processing protein RimM